MAQIKPLCPKLQEIAIKELGEVPERIQNDLAVFKLWLQQQSHLKARMDDQFLVQFLRGCKYSVEKAKEKIERFYTLKTKYPKMFGVSDIEDKKFQEIYNLGCFTFIPTPDDETAQRIVVMRWSYDPKTHILEEIFPAGCAMFEITLIDDPSARIKGVSYIVDMGNTIMGQYLQMTPMYIKNIATFFEKTIPLRIKSVYIINLSSISQQMLNLIMPFLSEKLRNKFIFCSPQDLSKYIPEKYIPSNYGGLNDSLESIIQQNAKRLQKYRQYFLENQQYGTDESLRMGPSRDFENACGVGGTFRKMAVD